MFSKKGVMDISIQLLVILVICIAILIFGLTFLYSLLTGVTETKEAVDVAIQERLAQEAQEEQPALAERPLTGEEMAVEPETTTLLAEDQNQGPPEESPPEPALEELAEKAAPEEPPEELQNCLDNFSCDDYFIFVPLGTWEAMGLFKAKAEERARFFTDISKFKFKKVGYVFMPLDFAEQCNIGIINPAIASQQIRIKSCADRYADRLGIDYEKAIGLSNSFTGGRTFFSAKSAYASLGYTTKGQEDEVPGLVAHELGHSYNLCDEYSWQDYQTQDRYLRQNTCENAFPERCRISSSSSSDELCLGHTPPYRDYQGEPVLNVCWGNVHYSVMGAASGSECGYDNTGGYEAVGGGS